MKRMLRFGVLKLAAILMVLSLAACGSGAMDMSKIEGTWSTLSIDGQDFKEYCDALGIDPSTSDTIWEVGKDSVTATASGQSMTLDVKVKSNGFELVDGDGNITMSVTYDEKNNTLSYKANDGTKDIEFVMAPYSGE